MTTEKDIRDMYTHLRETNQTIPSECLDFMLHTCLKALEDTKEKDKTFKVRIKTFKVKIKTWEAMEEEFGLDSIDYINCRYVFTDMMEDDLPTNRIIEVEESSDIYIWNCSYNWYISDDMIEEYL